MDPHLFVSWISDLARLKNQFLAEKNMFDVSHCSKADFLDLRHLVNS